MERLTKKTFWDSVKKEVFAAEASMVFKELSLDELKGSKGPAKAKVKDHIDEILERAGSGEYGGASWRQKSWHQRIEEFVNPDGSEVLKEMRRQASTRTDAFKRAFECCGTEESQRKRFKVSFAEASDDDSDDDSDSEY